SQHAMPGVTHAACFMRFSGNGRAQSIPHPLKKSAERRLSVLQDCPGHWFPEPACDKAEQLMPRQ
ncbi:hypothetical protein, partial [Xanthomonas arboricola]|uniref:hypothetical protein n=1 Tax=Xanthomonas arboricola TaxID=56448 RepID=UPI001E541C52